MHARKLLRTLQSELPFLKHAREWCYHRGRKLLRRASDPDFAALRFLPESLPGCYLDIGANQGQSIASMHLFRPRARIHAFEPNPGLAARLQRRYCGSATVVVHPYGLGASAQKMVLYTPVYNGFVYDGLASLHRESAANWLGPEVLYGFRPSRLTLRECACTIRRLDDEHLDPVFIKIDVQGHEYEVVCGGLETLGRCEPVLMIEDLAHRPRLRTLLDELGYRQYRFDGTGFYRAEDQTVVNFLLMTDRRATTVTRSVRAATPGLFAAGIAVAAAGGQRGDKVGS